MTRSSSVARSTSPVMGAILPRAGARWKQNPVILTGEARGRGSLGCGMRTNWRPGTVGNRALVLGVLLAAVLVPSGAEAAAGELDPTFGDAGRAEPPFATPW